MSTLVSIHTEDGTLIGGVIVPDEIVTLNNWECNIVTNNYIMTPASMLKVRVGPVTSEGM